MTNEEVLLKLLPPKTYSDDPDSLTRGDIKVQGDTLDDVEASAKGLLNEMFPDTADVTIVDWERVCALVGGDEMSPNERQDRVVSKLNEKAGIDADHILDVMEPLFGYRPTLHEHESYAEVGDEYWGFAIEIDENEIDPNFDYDHALRELQKIQPGHAQGRIGHMPFRCDDPQSLTDKDLLGS